MSNGEFQEIWRLQNLRERVIKLEQELLASRAATLREAADIASEAKAEDIAQRIRSLALWDGQSALDRERAEARLEEAEWWEKFFNTIAPPHYRTQRLAALRQAAGEPGPVATQYQGPASTWCAMHNGPNPCEKCKSMV